MSGEPVIIQFSWVDPVTGQPHHSSLQTPIAIGREASQMPDKVGNQPVSHLELDHKQVSRWHALITIVNRQLHITDKSANGTFLNGRLVRQNGQVFTSKDTLRVGPFKITAAVVSHDETNATELLNRDNSHFAKTGGDASPNAILVWLVGGLILLLMGGGIWLAAQTLLQRARPTIDSTSSSFLLDISDAEVETVETITKAA